MTSRAWSETPKYLVTWGKEFLSALMDKKLLKNFMTNNLFL